MQKIDWGTVYSLLALGVLGASLAEGNGFWAALLYGIFWPAKVGMWLYGAFVSV